MKKTYRLIASLLLFVTVFSFTVPANAVSASGAIDTTIDYYDYIETVLPRYAQFHRIFRFSAKAEPEVLDQVPNPDQQDQADGKSHKDLIHGFCGREIAEKDGHITAKSAQN